MLGAAVVMLREGFEISLVVAICLAFLDRSGRRDRSWVVWLATALALTLSALAAVGLLVLGHDLEGRAEQVWEGATMLAAAAVLSWMILWMRRHARLLRGELEQGLSSALSAGSLAGLGLVAFIGVLREGLETSLLLASAIAGQRPLAVLIGGSTGAVVAAALGYLFYRGSHRLDLRRFFSWTSVLLVLFAGWLVGRAYEELSEAQLLPQGELLAVGAAGAFIVVFLLAWLRGQPSSATELRRGVLKRSRLRRSG